MSSKQPGASQLNNPIQIPADAEYLPGSTSLSWYQAQSRKPDSRWSATLPKSRSPSSNTEGKLSSLCVFLTTPPTFPHLTPLQADKSLKNPLVITGVSKFARTHGIPYPEAILQVASLALSKILAALPEDVQEEVREGVEEIDAEELERNSSKEAEDEAKKVGKQVEEGEAAEAKDKRKKGDGCVIA